MTQIKKFPLKNLSGSICSAPFTTLVVDPTGNVSMCGCADWMPTYIGNIFATDMSISDLLKSDLAEDIRQSIIRGTYEYCNAATCGVINNNQLWNTKELDADQQQVINDPSFFLQPIDIFFAGDKTCNLTCPSCRTHVIKNKIEDVELQQQLGDKIRQQLFATPTDRRMQLRVSTSGEVFASNLLLKFINSIPIDKFPNLWLMLQSNGLLAERNWNKLGNMQHRVQDITVTIDAAQANTYELLRRGGKWEDILRSLKWLQEKKKENGMSLTTRMVVQRDNYQQIKEFYNLSKSFDASRVEYTRITNWGTFEGNKFDEIDVFNPEHPEFNLAQNAISQVQGFPDTIIYNGIEINKNA